MISDIEDGLRIGAIHWCDLKEEEIEILFEEAYIEQGEDDYNAFCKARSKTLTKIIKGVLEESEKNIRPYFRKNKLPNIDKLVIKPPEEMQDAISSVWKNIQRSKLFENVLVKHENNKAKHVVSCLFCQGIRHPELIPWTFRSRYKSKPKNKKIIDTYGGEAILSLAEFDLTNWHKKLSDILQCSFAQHDEKIKTTISDIICVKDFIAGMTDTYAESIFKSVVLCRGTKESWEEGQYETWSNNMKNGVYSLV